MVLVEGEFCTEVRQECEDWMDPPSAVARCRTFAPSTCVGAKVKRHFCIDKDEYVAPGESLPQNETSFTQAQQICEQNGKRLCKETEWESACEGEAMLPYPYGLTRDANKCHHDRGDLVDQRTGKLYDYRKPPAQLDKCLSPVGARNMTGNVDEWVVRDRTWGPYHSALKGGWWMAARNRCRPATTAHDEYYHGTQTGFRCCSDVP